MLAALRRLLPRIHPLDYEKIRFVCTWIVAALAEEVEMVWDTFVVFRVSVCFSVCLSVGLSVWIPVCVRYAFQCV